jgi:hypothetical protein
VNFTPVSTGESGPASATVGTAELLQIVHGQVAAVTVSTVLPLMLPTAALIVVVPVARVAAAPVELIVATLVADELQVAVVVMLAVLLSV